METRQPASAAPKKAGGKTWLIIGGVLLACCCVLGLAAILAGPAITTLFRQISDSGGLYSGRADEELKNDTLAGIRQAESAQGCEDVELFMGKVTRSPEQSGDGSWSELWQIQACGESHLYAIEFTPSPAGGTDMSIRRAD